MKYRCPTHSNISYTLPGVCHVYVQQWRECSVCGERNPRELSGIHKKAGCGGSVIDKGTICGQNLESEIGVQ